MDEIRESGFVGKDGKLRMPMDRLNGFFASHKGERLVAVFKVLDRRPTEAMLGYYYGYVLPTCRKAFFRLGYRWSERETDEFLVHEYGGEGTARELPQSGMSDFLMWLQQYAAENLDTFVEDPKTF